MNWFDSPAHWYVVGFGGQIAFASRFIVQWLVSEKNRRIVIPKAFWYLSLFGGAALFVYALHKKDPVFALGQGLGLLVYVRNLMLHKSRAETA